MSIEKVNYKRLLTADLFLFCLLTLLLNDFIFKYKFPGFLTSKLSDVSGLFAFPYFFSVFFSRQRKVIYVLTCVFFTFWKLPVTDDFLEIINSLNLLYFKRMKDPTDLFALLILPFSYIYFTQQINSDKMVNQFQVYLISITSLFAFTATSLGYENYEKKLALNQEFIVPVKKKPLLSNLSPGGTSFTNTRDRVFYYYVTLPAKPKIIIKYQVTLKTKSPNYTLVELNEVTDVEIENDNFFRGPNDDYVKEVQSYTPKEFIRIFKTLVIDKVNAEQAVRNVYFAEKSYEDAGKLQKSK